MRLYSTVEVAAVSKAKMDALQTTLHEVKLKAKERGEAVKRRKITAVEKHRAELVDALTAHGLETDPYPIIAENYIQNSWRRRRSSLEEVVESIVVAHDLREHVPIDQMQSYFSQQPIDVAEQWHGERFMILLRCNASL